MHNYMGLRIYKHVQRDAASPLRTSHGTLVDAYILQLTEFEIFWTVCMILLFLKKTFGPFVRIVRSMLFNESTCMNSIIY